MNREYQNEVRNIVIHAFGADQTVNEKGRLEIFVKKSLEFARSLGASGVSQKTLVEVFGNPGLSPDETRAQTAGGVAFTLAALCNAIGINLEDAALGELDRLRIKHGIDRPEVAAPVEEVTNLRHIRALLLIADSHQGANGKAGAVIAEALGIPHPITMPNLAKTAMDIGLNPDELWPWLGEQNPRLTRAALEAGVSPEADPLVIGYRNHRDEYAERKIVPIRVYYGSTEWHPEPQWLLEAFDLDRQELRDFAMQDFGTFPVPEPVPVPERILVEGDLCPNPKCDGLLGYKPVENCTCHVAPPCGACVDNPLVCLECGHDPDFREVEPATLPVGFTEWEGKGPAPGGKVYYFTAADNLKGGPRGPIEAQYLRWGCSGREDDIVAWRVATEEEKKAAGQ